LSFVLSQAGLLIFLVGACWRVRTDRVQPSLSMWGWSRPIADLYVWSRAGPQLHESVVFGPPLLSETLSKNVEHGCCTGSSD
jgi:hypothetical protein